MRGSFPPEWRAQSRRKRRFYATYMRWLERVGFVVVLAVLAAFVFAFNYKVDDLVSADEVKIEPFGTPIVALEPTLVVHYLASDDEKVHLGQPLMEVVEGVPAIRQWIACEQMVGHIKRAPADVELSPYSLERPSTRTIVAPAGGTYRIDLKASDLPCEKGGVLARIVDYHDLRLAASLAGQTAPKAQVGQWAKVTGISFEPEAGTFFRGNGAAKPVLSGKLLGDEVKGLLDNQLVGSSLELRDDVPLQVTNVESVQIDATLETSHGGSAGLLLDPPGNYELRAQVIEGKPVATAQIAVLPSEVGRQAQATIGRVVRGKTVRLFDGSVERLDGVKDVRMVVTVRADRLDGKADRTLSGAVVKRSFDAVLKIADPPVALIDAVREADRGGKAVTARVELRTGSRPIALLLLKKS